MATDQPTDATAARLRERLFGNGSRILMDYLVGVAQSCPDCKMGLPCSHYRTLAAALDTLIRYHRSVGAVEALEAVKCRGYTMTAFAEPYTCIEWDRGRGEIPPDLAMCDRCTTLAAAQERLAAFGEARVQED